MNSVFTLISDAQSAEYWDTADFSDCPRPPVMDEDVRMLSKWRTCPWGCPARRLALSLSNNDILYAYRRIWGRSPMPFLPGNSMQPIVQEWHGYDYAISGTELELIAHHLCGWRYSGSTKPHVKRIVCEVADLDRRARNADEI